MKVVKIVKAFQAFLSVLLVNNLLHLQPCLNDASVCVPIRNFISDGTRAIIIVAGALGENIFLLKYKMC